MFYEKKMQIYFFFYICILHTNQTMFCGDKFTMCLTRNGLFGWGQNQYGQLGLGHDNAQLVHLPQKIPLDEVFAVWCGGGHVFANTKMGNLLETN